VTLRLCEHCEGDGFVVHNCGCREAVCPHTPIIDPTDPQPGLYQKFHVRRTDGTSRPGCKHEHCDYLVLDWKHDKFAIPAALAYAAACEHDYPDLAMDIRARVAQAKCPADCENRRAGVKHEHT